MIRFTLRCPEGHGFESWFRSGQAFEALAAEGRVACPECGATSVEKAPMAPRVAGAATDDGAETARRLADLRARIESHTEDVGTRFAAEARAMHLGDLPERPIRGQARADEARALVEDGVPILPIPPAPKSLN